MASSSLVVNDGQRDLMPESSNNQVSIVAFVHDLYVAEATDEKPSEKQDDQQKTYNAKKKYANCYLQSESGWHFARIWGNEKNVHLQHVFLRMKEAAEQKKAIKLIAKKGFDLSKK